MIWKDIVGYEGYYKINEYGDIKNTKTGKIRKLKPNLRHGYIDVDLYKDGICEYKRVHRLVAEAFIPNPEDLPIVMHKDNDKTNNHYSNLKWGTISDNTKQAFEDDLIDTNKKYILFNEIITITLKGLQEVVDTTGYSKSSILYYIENETPLMRGEYKGFYIKNLGRF